MSDQGRKDFITQAKEKITPDSTKSTQEKAKESLTGTTDRIARGVQGDESKSTGQEIHDKAQRTTDRQEGGTLHNIGDKVKGALSMDK